MENGRVIEFDNPNNLLNNSNSKFSIMLLHQSDIK